MPKKSIAEIRKQEIVEHFYEVIISEGFENASMGKVAKRMEVNSSLLIHYFSTKEEMILALIDFVVAKYEKTFLPLLESTETPGERLHMVLDSLFSADWDNLTDSRCFYSIYPLILFRATVKVKFQELYSKFKEALVKEISLAIEGGLIPEKEADLSASLIISMLEGANFYGNILNNQQENEKILSALREQAWQMLSR